MAFDLSTTPRSDIIVQASGDAHLSNFGLFASPERTLVFDSNDFDETLPGPWEWDVKRLAASVVIAARAQRLQRRPRPGRRSWPPSAPIASRWPATRTMRLLDIWYDQTTAADIEAAMVEAIEAGTGPAVSVKDAPRELERHLHQGPLARTR